MMGHCKKKATMIKLWRVWYSMHPKTCSQNAEIELSNVQTHIYDTSFLKTSKTWDGTKQFQDDEMLYWIKITAGRRVTI